MNITCLSASNIRHARENSTSLRVCRLIRELVAEMCPAATVEIVPLVDYDLKPCHGCGACLGRGSCACDPAFNALYAGLARADGLFIVAAHYAPIPAKLCMLLEKVEQLAFLPRFQDESRHSPLYGRPVGIVGHGGGTEEISNAYRGLVLDAIANALSWPVEMRIVGAGEEWPNGVVFPVQRVSRDPRSPFPVQEYDWDEIGRRLAPLVRGVLEAV